MFHKEKLSTTPYQRFLNLLSFLLFLGLFLYPVLIPSLIGGLLYGLLIFVGHFPDIWNVPVKITAENKDWVYRNVKSLLSTINFLVMLVYFYINYQSLSQKNLNPIFIAGLLFSLFASIFFFCLRCKKTPPAQKDVS